MANAVSGPVVGGKRAKLGRRLLRLALIPVVIYLMFLGFLYSLQRSFLYFPSHNTGPTMLAPWLDGRETIGYCRVAPHPRAIWLMTHGNAGQAADRDYVLQCMSKQDSLYVLEYPGYGARPGKPSMQSMDKAAAEAYELLRDQNPHTPVCVLGESIGSGPACSLAREKTPPDKIVLTVPFDTLANVAAEKIPYFPIRLILCDKWDNVEALKGYAGPVEIFAAERDEIIPNAHARALARQVPGAKLVVTDGGHNDWSNDPRVRLEP